MSIRDTWKEHKTGITLFVGSIFSIVWGIVIIFLEIRNAQNVYETTKDIVEEISLSVPVSAVITTFIAGVFDMSLWFSDNARKSLKRKAKQAQKRADKQVAERDALWIEWAENGKDPDKMPSKVNPINKEITKKDSSKKE